MDRNPRPTSILNSLGEEIIRIITPVSICMLLVVILVSILNDDSSSASNLSSSMTTIATMAYSEDSSDSIGDKLKGALLNSLVFVGVITVVTFILFCVGFVQFHCCWCFGCVHVKNGYFLTQAYLVVIGMLVAYWFTLLPEWTTWVLLVAMALYDLAAVMLPGGPLRLLVELAISRDEDIPALVYEARPVTYNDSVPRGSVIQRRVWRDRSNIGSEGDEIANSGSNPNLDANSGLNSSLTVGTCLHVGSDQNERNLVHAEEGRVSGGDSQLTAPLVERRISVQMHLQEDAASGENMALEGIGLGSSGAIKLGLGDFIFYSVLVGRAAMYDFMTVYACYLAIIAGLGITLVLLAFYQKALPALPFSVMLDIWLLCGQDLPKLLGCSINMDVLKNKRSIAKFD
ncbi:presenilin-2 [Actinidia rufa]|uniref:Presenilin-2 n=1 Tax=Actinidia rufa TaxID=165716 RepID=A0A7J0H1W3_9ERIC|nr:presenilin-2 [Actinidia rufa]